MKALRDVMALSTERGVLPWLKYTAWPILTTYPQPLSSRSRTGMGRSCGMWPALCRRSPVLTSASAKITACNCVWTSLGRNLGLMSPSMRCKAVRADLSPTERAWSFLVEVSCDLAYTGCMAERPTAPKTACVRKDSLPASRPASRGVRLLSSNARSMAWRSFATLLGVGLSATPSLWMCTSTPCKT